MEQQLTESLMLSIYLSEKEDLRLLKKNVKVVYCEILKVIPDKGGGHHVDLLVESPTQLFLLGKYVGFDRETILDEPQNN